MVHILIVIAFMIVVVRPLAHRLFPSGDEG